jgi:ketosteroid isomerase-like protein
VDDGEQLIREVWQRWNEGDRRPDAEEIDPEIEVHSALAVNVYSGRLGVESWIAEIDDQFDSWELDVDVVRVLEPDRYIVHGAIRARGRNSGVDLDQPASWLVDIRDGRLVRIRNFIGATARETSESAAAV